MNRESTAPETTHVKIYHHRERSEDHYNSIRPIAECGPRGAYAPPPSRYRRASPVPPFIAYRPHAVLYGRKKTREDRSVVAQAAEIEAEAG